MIRQILRLAQCSLVATCIALNSKSSPPDAAIWRREVPQNVDIRSRNGGRLLDRSRAGLTFQSNETLLIYSVYGENKELSSRKSPELSSPFRLHAWVFNSRSGEIEDQKELATRANETAMDVTNNGVLVRTGEILRLYSPDFKEMRDLPLSLDPNSRFSTSVSWSGKTIMVDRLPPKGTRVFSDRLDVFDAESLRARYSWEQFPPFNGSYSISDIGIVAATSNGRYINYVRFGSSRWQSIFDDPKRTCAGDQPTQVTDQLIVIHCKELTVLTPEGVSYSLPIDRNSGDDALAADCALYDGSTWTKTGVSLASPVVAFTLPLLKTKRPFLGEPTVCMVGMQVVGFDLNRRKQVIKLDIRPLPKNDYDFALSPDGSQLAILDDGAVSVYAIPTHQKESSDRGQQGPR